MLVMVVHHITGSIELILMPLSMAALGWGRSTGQKAELVIEF